MSENLEGKVVGNESVPNTGEFSKKIRHIDSRGGVHEFDSTEELMQWREDENNNKHNS